MVDEPRTKSLIPSNNVRGWWSETIDGGTEKLNDEFIYRTKTCITPNKKLIKLIPGKKVIWLVTDSELNFIKNKSEWTGIKN